MPAAARSTLGTFNSESARPVHIFSMLIPGRILFNASFGIYHPYQDRLEVIEFPGITRNPDFHIGGVGWDKYTGLASVIVGQGNAFNTNGANITGDNFIKKFDPSSRTFVWTQNLTSLTQGKWGGFNDITTDPAGVTRTSAARSPRPSSRSTPRGKTLTAWVPPVTTDHTVRGYLGNRIERQHHHRAGQLGRVSLSFRCDGREGHAGTCPSNSQYRHQRWRRHPPASSSAARSCSLPSTSAECLCYGPRMAAGNRLNTSGWYPMRMAYPPACLRSRPPRSATACISSMTGSVTRRFLERRLAIRQASPMVDITHQVDNLLCKASKKKRSI